MRCRKKAASLLLPTASPLTSRVPLRCLSAGPNERQLCVYSFCGGLIVEIHDSVRLRLN